MSWETDDDGPWSLSVTSAYYTAGRAGIGTSSPGTTLEGRSAAGTNPLQVRGGGILRLLTYESAGVRIGAGFAPPDAGLYVNGQTRLGTTASGLGRLRSAPSDQATSRKAGSSTSAGPASSLARRGAPLPGRWTRCADSRACCAR